MYLDRRKNTDWSVWQLCNKRGLIIQKEYWNIYSNMISMANLLQGKSIKPAQDKAVMSLHLQVILIIVMQIKRNGWQWTRKKSPLTLFLKVLKKTMTKNPVPGL